MPTAPAKPARVVLYLTADPPAAAHLTKVAATAASKTLRAPTTVEVQLETISDALALSAAAIQVGWELAERKLAARLAEAFPDVTELTVEAYEHESGRSFALGEVNGQVESDLHEALEDDDVMREVLDVVHLGAGEHEHHFTFTTERGTFV